MKINKFLVIAFLFTISLLLPWKTYQARTVINPDSAALVSNRNWQSFSSQSGLFKIEMPGLPQEKREETEILGNSKDWHLFTFKEDYITYMLGYLDLSETEISEGSKDAVGSIKNLILTPLGLTELELTGREIVLNNYPGKEFLTLQSSQIVGLRVYLVQNRLYGLFARADNIGDINHYFNSFQVNNIWELFNSNTGNFAIKLPNSPRQETETMLVGEQEIIWNIVSAKDFTFLKNRELENIYAAGYADLPTNFSQQDRNEVLNKIGDSLLNRLSIDLFNHRYRKVFIDDHLGLEFMGIKNNQLFAVRVYQINNRLYGLFSVANDLNKIENFLESFQLLS